MSTVKQCKACGQGFNADNQAVGEPVTTAHCPNGVHEGPFEYIPVATAATGLAYGAAIFSSPKTSSHYAEEILTRNGFDFTKIPYYDGDLSGVNIEGEISSTNFTDEYHFNAFMYPLLSSALPAELTLVNSERHKYLEVVGGSSRHDLKPDFWVSFIPDLISRKDPPELNAVEGCTYGCPLVNCAFTVDCIMDGKRSKVMRAAQSLSQTDIGKLFWYLDALSASGNANPRGVFYNSYQYVFAEFRERELVSIERCWWTTNGSLTHLVELLRLSEPNGTVLALRHFLALDGNPRIHSALGRGRFGCVFDVSLNGQHFALKVVAAEAANPQAYNEYERMVYVHQLQPELFAEVVPNSFVQTENFIYYRMSDVGKGGNHKIQARPVVLKLAEIHSHGIIHGDPRIQNIIELENGSLKWIDLRAPNVGSVSDDAKVLFGSIFDNVNIFAKGEISAAVADYTYAVSKHASLEELKKLIQKVYDDCKLFAL